MLSAARDNGSAAPSPVRITGSRARAILGARGVIALVVGLSLALISDRGSDVPPVVAASEVGVQPAHLALAQAFTAALNAHDVEALVDLFSDEGAGPTVRADRYAWTKFEIRLWTQHQIRSNIRVDASEY